MKNLEDRNFKILRIYAPSVGIATKIIKTGLTKAEALAHCSRADTQKEGVYFDGWTKGEE